MFHFCEKYQGKDGDRLGRKLAAVLTACALVLFGGCSIGDVETLLRAPRPTGDQQEIQQALDAYISRQGGSKEYILKYPQDGEYLSAFVMEDIDGDEEEEAIAFYQFSGEGERTHINLLDKVDDEWQSMSDIEGFSTDISGVMFGDLDADGVQELLAGWSVYNSRDRRLAVYSLAEGRITVRSDDQYYTHVVVDDFVVEGRDDLLLFQTDSTQNISTVRLQTLRTDGLHEQGRTRIDGYIRSFGEYHVGLLAEDLYGVYIDCYKDADTTITELIYWDGSQLHAPFYNSADNITTLTARQASIPSMDVDGTGGRDSQIEWPYCTRLPGYETASAAESMWLTQWMFWNYDTQKEQRLFASIVNMTDSYYLLIPDTWLNAENNAWNGTVTATYDSSQHKLQIHPYSNGQTGEAFLTVRVGTDEELDEAAGEPLEIVDAQGNRVRYQVEYDAETYDLDMERVQYIIRPL